MPAAAASGWQLPAARCHHRPRMRIITSARSRSRGGTFVAGGGRSSSSPAPLVELSRRDEQQPEQAEAVQEQPAAAASPPQGGWMTSQQPGAATAAAAAAAAATAAAAAPTKKPGWMSQRNVAFAGSAIVVVFLTVFRKQLAPLLKWAVMQATSLSDKSVIGEVNIESFATTGAVLLTLFWSYAEFERSSERMASLQALETALEVKQGHFEERLVVVEAKEAALEAREDQLEASAAAARLALEAELGALAARLAALEARGPPGGGGS